MCGRFAQAFDRNSLQKAFPGVEFPRAITPRYNVAPTQPVLVIPNGGYRRADFFLWGLIPHWSKDPSIGARLINARAESAHTKPSFRDPFRYRRCLIPASGFYEWQETGGRIKQPWYFYNHDHRPLALAGLWDVWQAPDGSAMYSCTILTTQANPDVAPIHHRMPVLLPPAAWESWLSNGDANLMALFSLLRPPPAGTLARHPVSTLVNKTGQDSPQCIVPIAPPQ